MPPSISDPAAPPESVPNRRVLWPADYYSGPTPKPVLPPWASYLFGGLAVLVLVLVFTLGAWLSGGGFLQFLDLAFGMTLGEMRGMYTQDVTEAQKKTLEQEIETMREGVRNGQVPVKNLQTVLRQMQKAIGDEKLNAAEVNAITQAARAANQSRKVSKSQSPKDPPPLTGGTAGL